MLLVIVLVALAVFLAANMGGSTFGVTFAAACGSRILSKRMARMMYTASVILGAVWLGSRVTATLQNGIIPARLISVDVCIIILLSSALCMWMSNILGVPQSTSLVAVGSIMGVGIYFRSVFWKSILWMVPFWVLLPVAGYLLTYGLGRLVYPPRRGNLWIYEKLVNHSTRLKIFVILATCYNAISVGANNVANVVGPLVGAGLILPMIGLIVVAPFFGLGSMLFPENLDTASQKIVPLGLLTASIICVVCGTLIIIASLCGVPQSFVMVKLAAIFAVASLKDESGHAYTFTRPVPLYVIAP